MLTVKCFKFTDDGKKLNYLRPYSRQDPSERQILIEVEDIDDNSPVFEKNNVTIGIRLNVPPDTTLIRLHAVDKDANSPPMEYYISNITFTRLGKYDSEVSHMNNQEENLFQIDMKTGELKTSNAMQRFTDGYFNVVIFANNTDNPAKRSNLTVRVSI